MEKLENSNDKEKYQVIADEIQRVRQLIDGHKKLLKAIGEL